LYDIRPGNGAGLFLQPWSPHGRVGAGVGLDRLLWFMPHCYAVSTTCSTRGQHSAINNHSKRTGDNDNHSYAAVTARIRLRFDSGSTV